MPKLVSVIIPTRNSAEFLVDCLESIKHQNYKELEIIVVDNNSTDNTKEIARRYTSAVFNHGPERSSQRNFGVTRSNGTYLLFVDSDMKLEEGVVRECVGVIEFLPTVSGVIIPEESFGSGFWAHCKKLERSFYLGIDWVEAARFFKKKDFELLNGYDEQIVGGEDWDLSGRAEKMGKISRITSFIFHNEGSITLTRIVKKRYYYGQGFRQYMSSHKESRGKQTNILKRYELFFSNPSKLLKDPIVGIGMLYMKTWEFAASGLGYFSKAEEVR